jgi:hypothetical protein
LVVPIYFVFLELSRKVSFHPGDTPNTPPAACRSPAEDHRTGALDL